MWKFNEFCLGVWTYAKLRELRVTTIISILYFRFYVTYLNAKASNGITQFVRRYVLQHNKKGFNFWSGSISVLKFVSYKKNPSPITSILLFISVLLLVGMIKEEEIYKPFC